MEEKAFELLWKGLLQGERLSLSKAITLVETSRPELFPFRDRLLMRVEKLPGKETFRLAVTGVPGAGKSTLINQLGLQWIKEGHKVAVLAIDPSSEISQGSVLGDKTRMAELSREENAFIRPSPTRLHLGGVTSSTFETILLCEAAGYDRILVETVGVGQSELEAAQLTDACLLLLIAGAGDELQAVKKGILESADVILVNKADGENRGRAQSFARELKQVSAIWKSKNQDQQIEILSGSGNDPEMIIKLSEMLSVFQKKILENGVLVHARHQQKLGRVDTLISDRLKEYLNYHPEWMDMRSGLLKKANIENTCLYGSITYAIAGFFNARPANPIKEQGA